MDAQYLFSGSDDTNVRLWRALGVWWGGIGLFLDGYVLVPTVHPARKPEPLRVKTGSALGASHQAHILRVRIAQLDTVPRQCISLNHGETALTRGGHTKNTLRAFPKK